MFELLLDWCVFASLGQWNSPDYCNQGVFGIKVNTQGLSWLLLDQLSSYEIRGWTRHYYYSVLPT